MFCSLTSLYLTFMKNVLFFVDTDLKQYLQTGFDKVTFIFCRYRYRCLTTVPVECGKRNHYGSFPLSVHSPRLIKTTALWLQYQQLRDEAERCKGQKYIARSDHMPPDNGGIWWDGSQYNSGDIGGRLIETSYISTNCACLCVAANVDPRQIVWLRQRFGLAVKRENTSG